MTTLKFNIVGDAKGALDAMHKVEAGAGEAKGKIGEKFKELGGIVAGAFAADKIVGFFGDSMAEARESQKVNAQTAAVLKSTGGAAKVTADQIGDLATAISNKTGIDDEAIQSSANMLLTFTNIRNEVGKGNDVFNQATSIVTDMSVAMGTDAKAAAIQVGKALNDPIKGITALSKVGVTFTDQQKAQISAMVKVGDTAGAQKVILRELNKEFGGSAAAQATSADKAKVAWGNLKEQVGTALIPVVDKFANIVTRDVIPAISGAVTWIQKNKDLVKDLAIALGIAGAAIGIYTGVTKAVKFATEAWEVAQKILNGTLRANPIGLIVTALTLLVAGLMYAYQHSETFRNIVKGVFDAVATAGRFMWENVLKPAFDALKAAWGVIGTVFSTTWNSVLKPVFKFLVDTALLSFGIIIRGAADAFGWVPGVGGKLKQARDRFNDFKTQVDGIFADVNNHAVVKPRVDKGAADHVSAALSSYVSYWNGVLGQIGKGQPIMPNSPGLTGLPVLIGANAQGTGFWGGGWTKINERGGELAYLPGGSAVVPASQTAAMFAGGGGAAPVVINIGSPLMTKEDVGRAVSAALEAAANAGVRMNFAKALA